METQEETPPVNIHWTREISTVIKAFHYAPYDWIVHRHL